MTIEHTKITGGDIRTDEAKYHKLKYLPFVEHILANGKLVTKSYRKYYIDEEGVRHRIEPHKRVTYGVICRVEYFDKGKGKKVKESVEMAVAYDEIKKQYVLSFQNYDAKKL